MRNLLFPVILLGAIFLTFSMKKSEGAYDKCGDCEYDLKFVKSINGGDDKEYELKCKSKITKMSIWQRKNGKWERTGSREQFEKCELIKERCDCED
mgnify:CR=1 FL=1